MSTSDEVGKLLIFLFYRVYATHPYPVMRMHELDKWHKSGAFDKIMAGDFIKVATDKPT